MQYGSFNLGVVTFPLEIKLSQLSACANISLLKMGIVNIFHIRLCNITFLSILDLWPCWSDPQCQLFSVSSGALWVNVCFKCHENRCILRPISWNSDMVMFLIWYFVKTHHIFKPQCLSSVLSQFRSKSKHFLTCKTHLKLTSCFFGHHQQTNCLWILNLWIFIKEKKWTVCYVNIFVAILKGLDIFFLILKKRNLLKSFNFFYFILKGVLFAKTCLEKG